MVSKEELRELSKESQCRWMAALRKAEAEARTPPFYEGCPSYEQKGNE